MNTKTNPLDQHREPEAVASFVVGMVAHTVAHAHLKSESRQGKLKNLVNMWTERAGADPAMVNKTLERLATDPMAWDAAGRQSAAIFNKKLALRAVQESEVRVSKHRGPMPNTSRALPAFKKTTRSERGVDR